MGFFNRGKVVEQSHRVLTVNNRDANAPTKFASNSVSTGKYTIITYFPKSLFEQFRRVANCYFLVVALISLTPVSPVSPISNIFPLIFVLGVSMIKEGYEDFQRHKSDKQLNMGSTEIYTGDSFLAAQWKDIHVGDIVRVHDKQPFPADIMLLTTSNPEGVGYVQTMNLDGETNLKIRKAGDAFWDYNESTLNQLQGTIECDPPNNSLYTFTGNFEAPNGAKVSISPSMIGLRGSSLRNTEWAIGVVVYTGHDTKVMQNATGAPSKRSTLEKKLDIVVYFLLFVLLVLSLIGAIVFPLWQNESWWYLQLQNAGSDFNPNNNALVGVLNFFTLFILYGIIIPISLYVTLELIKVVQVFWINMDKDIYYEPLDYQGKARTSNINEELGQIQYIMSDKTGTLTQNLMEFFKCTVAGIVYGKGVTEVQRAGAERTGMPLGDHQSSPYLVKELGVNFDDERLVEGNWKKEPQPELIEEFFRCLAVCHTVLPEGEEEPDKIVYQASSPDELALVTAAKVFGFFFYRRTNTAVYVRETGALDNPATHDVEYQILATLEFNSTRKRQSVIVKNNEGNIRLYTKGADNVIFARLSPTGTEHREDTQSNLEAFGADGLRTLCLAYRDIPQAEYDEWFKTFDAARTSMTDREQMLDDAAELIEIQLTLLGCTAIEDKLQDGVPQTIADLRKAGLAIWVLTGDKIETAINIGYACNLLHNDQRQFVIDSNSPDIQRALSVDNKDERKKAAMAEVRKQLEQALVKAREVAFDSRYEAQEVAMVIDGTSLIYALEPGVSDVLLELGLICKAVVACRVSPLQKALVTKLVRYGTKTPVLAIGDGANDCSMIQAANVGVGIKGQEGSQAVMSADFAIGQFRFLKNLMLIHGRYDYLRLSRTVNFFFYKNTVFSFATFFFSIYAAFSGQTPFQSWYFTFFNLFFTAAVPFVIGGWDQDVDKYDSMRHPKLYEAGPADVSFNPYTFFCWFASGVYTAAMCWFIPAYVLGPSGINSAGHGTDIWMVGSTCVSMVIVTVNLRPYVDGVYFNWLFHVAIWGSIALLALFNYVYGLIPPTYSAVGEYSLYNVFADLSGVGTFWAVCFCTLFTCLLPDFSFTILRRELRPFHYELVMEENAHIRKLEKSGARPELPLRPDSTAQPKLDKQRTGFAFDAPFDSYFQQQPSGASSNATDFVNLHSAHNLASGNVSVSKNLFQQAGTSISPAGPKPPL